MTPATALLDVPGARIHHEVRGTGPLVALVGSPMAAGFFGPLAELLALDHTVVTLDPRGVGRSPVDDPDADSAPETRADDLARVLAHVDAGPATVLGSSGGAVVALALAQAHPGRIAAVIAHEPPLEELLPDREARRAASDDLVATYLAEGAYAAWGKFLAAAGLETPATGDAPPEADRDPQDVVDERHFFLHEMRPTTRFVPDLEALRAVRVVPAIGDESAGQLCDRTTRALAAGLGVEPVSFPGGHVGFVTDPVAFEARWRELLPG